MTSFCVYAQACSHSALRERQSGGATPSQLRRDFRTHHDDTYMFRVSPDLHDLQPLYFRFLLTASLDVWCHDSEMINNTLLLVCLLMVCAASRLHLPGERKLSDDLAGATNETLSNDETFSNLPDLSIGGGTQCFSLTMAYYIVLTSEDHVWSGVKITQRQASRCSLTFRTR